jgi:Leucine-rich repeat (LRR) protein
MEDASKDVLFTIALNLDLPSILKWCSSNSRINRYICQNDNFWRSKLLKDYPDYQKFDLNRSLKETYVFLYQLFYIRRVLDTNDSITDIFLKEELDLSGKGLKKVPAFDLPNLQDLYLNDNNLTKVPAFDLPNLQILYLRNNELVEVPAFDLPNLQILYLRNNELLEVPAFDLPDLQYLDLSNNNLTEVPAFDLPNLRQLYLYNNNLTELPEFNLPNLQILDLRNNKLSEEDKVTIKQKYPDVIF